MSLRDQSLRGGAYLAGRQAFGVALRLVGVLAITRIIGPGPYGLYAGSLVAVTLCAALAQLGTEAYLVRLPGDVADAVYDRTFTFLLVSSTVITTLGIAGTLAAGWVADGAEFTAPLAVMMLTIPINVLWAPAQARIEREFRYRRMAVLEMGGDIALYGIAVPLAVLGWGVWAPVTGYFAFQLWLLLGSYVAARYRPRWSWSRENNRAVIDYGRPYTASTLLMHGAELTNPVVVGALVGAEGVGVVALVIRIVDTLGFVMKATQRLSLVAFGRVQEELPRLRRAIDESMALQLLLLGPPLAGFALVADWAIPFVFGDEWRPAVDVYPLYALGFLLRSGFLVQGYALQTIGRNAPVARAAFLHLVVLAVTSAVAVPFLGVTGWSVGILVAAFSWLLIPLELRKIVPVTYARAWPWVVASAPALFAPLLPMPERLVLVVPALVVVALPGPRREIVNYIRMAWGMVRHRENPIGG